MKDTLGALLMLFGAVALAVAFVATLFTVLGTWAGIGGVALVAVILGRFLLEVER